ncbi:MAG: class I SAM-dependent DNA methyltransferase [Gemmatimonadales bacterium]
MRSPGSPNPQMPARDPSHGYEARADQFMAGRTHSQVGATVVREWARRLPPGSAVLDLGCGPGVPIAQVLIDAGLAVHAIDASPAMIAAFRKRFPGVPSECNAVEKSAFFGKRFEGVVAWGLMFLLPPGAQARLIRKVARALKPDGRFLYTSPSLRCEWRDNLTGTRSVSLGSDRYRTILAAAGLHLLGEQDDEGRNHYYFTVKPEPGPSGSGPSTRCIR